MERNLNKTSAKNARLNRLNGFMSAYFNWLLVLVVALILIFGYVLVIGPKYKQVGKKLALVNDNLDQKFSDLSRYLNKLKEINQSYNNVRLDNLDKIKKFLPNDPQVEDLFEKLQLVCEKNGVLLSSLSVMPSKSDGVPAGPNNKVPGGVGTVQITMSVGGLSYGGFKNFLATLENSLRLIDISNLGYNPQNESGSISMTAYYLK